MKQDVSLLHWLISAGGKDARDMRRDRLKNMVNARHITARAECYCEYSHSHLPAQTKDEIGIAGGKAIKSRITKQARL